MKDLDKTHKVGVSMALPSGVLEHSYWANWPTRVMGVIAG